MSLSQTVILTVITAGDLSDCVKLFCCYVDVSELLLSKKYGNLFSFMAIMQGLSSPQVRQIL